MQGKSCLHKLKLCVNIRSLKTLVSSLLKDDKKLAASLKVADLTAFELLLESLPAYRSNPYQENVRIRNNSITVSSDEGYGTVGIRSRRTSACDGEYYVSDSDSDWRVNSRQYPDRNREPADDYQQYQHEDWTRRQHNQDQGQSYRGNGAGRGYTGFGRYRFDHNVYRNG